MALNTINTDLSFQLKGQVINAPVEWEDISVVASFDNESVQANITFDSFRFVLDAAKILRNEIDVGFPGIFEGVPFKIGAQNNSLSLDVFDGFVQMSRDVALLEDGSVVANIQKRNGLNSLEERLEALTWTFLEGAGKVGNPDYIDMDYGVVKKLNLIELIIAGITLFMMIKEFIESIQRISYLVTEVVSTAASGTFGSIGAAILLAAKTLINIAYTLILAIAIINLGKQLIESLVPPSRTHRVMTLRRGMEIIFNHLGLTLVSTVTELDRVVFLPSNPRQDDVSLSTGFITKLKGTPSGIPNSVDFGNNCLDFVSVIKNLVYGKFAVRGNNVHFESFNNPFWQSTSTFVLPDVLLEQQKFNTDEFKSNFIFSFAIDRRDDWTIDDDKGRGIERITDAIQTVNLEAKDLPGVNHIRIPWALGSRKDELNAIEKKLLIVAEAVDEITGILGNGTSFATSIKNKVGQLRVSDNSHTLPKLIFTNGTGKIPANHKTLFSAKLMEQKYWKETSFVQDNFQAQKITFENIRIPFGLINFNQLVDNSFFTDNLNRKGKITNIDWTMSQDFAIISFWIRQIYAPNLKETFIEV